MDADEQNRDSHTATSDPSSLTTQQLWREVLNLRELLESRITGIEKSIEVAHNDLVRVPTDVQKQVGNLKELHDEKFRSIQVQFEERDTRTEQKDRDTKIAIDAAFQSASTAVAKSETVTSKQIDQLITLIQTETRALGGQINDLKERMTRFESLGIGEKGGRASQQQMITWILMIVVALISIAAFFRGLRV
jgi:hypothetical protein